MGSDTILIRDGSTLTIKDNSVLGIKGIKDSEHIHIDIDKVQNIAPVAAHIKEVNHIDPISVESLHVSEVRNIEPINIEKFNVTNLPMVNMSLQQLPPVDLNIRKLPPVSVGLYQDFQVPSDYTVSGRLLGIEFFRIRIDGYTKIVPKERFRQEQEKTGSRSFAVPSASGNPSIPSIRKEISTITSYRSSCRPRNKSWHGGVGFNINKGFRASHRVADGYTTSPGTKKKGDISFGMSQMNFYMSGPEIADNAAGSSVSSGE